MKVCLGVLIIICIVGIYMSVQSADCNEGDVVYSNNIYIYGSLRGNTALKKEVKKYRTDDLFRCGWFGAPVAVCTCTENKWNCKHHKCIMLFTDEANEL